MPESELPPLSVRLPDGGELRFTQPFHIGRDESCEVQVQDAHVSRRHAVVSFTRGAWTIRDLQSSNGLLVDGERVESAPIGAGLTVVLGLDGPSLEILPAKARATAQRTRAPEPDDLSTEDSVIIAQRYFGSAGEDTEEVGERTMMIRKAFQKVQQKQKRQYRWVIAAVLLVGISAAGYAYYAHRQLAKLAADAERVFYDMKDIDVIIAGLQQDVGQSGNSPLAQKMKTYMAQRREMENNYERYAANLYDRRLDEKDRLILQVTRKFGECELAAPPDYIREVKRYIQMWQSTGRFLRAVKTAQDLGYTKTIAAEFKARDLPPEFFYLAMQESSFDAFITGPPTRFGFAKGMWQFIPDTGRQYGLAIGPLRDVPRPDAMDDRFKWDKATNAAARYIKDIYATDAQASGLLVMASYNWGERRVIGLIRKMPANARERNFWKLLEHYREQIPSETYNYVFSIVSAAVIGENPRLFGIQTDNPLKFLNE
jgi:peptidoglycan lytic transglycosylase D